MGTNSYKEYDVQEIRLENSAYFDLKFLAKFLFNNKESVEKMTLKHVTLENFGVAFAPKLEQFQFGPEIQTIHIENVNFNKVGLSGVIKLC